jgi:hypothetical protein
MFKMLVLVPFYLLFSCSEGTFPNYIQDEVTTENNSFLLFKGFFKELDASSRGHYLIWIRKKQIYARIIFSKAPKVSRVHQYIHQGDRCPNRSDDENADGKLSFLETIAISGAVIIPLDGDINSQLKGLNWFPGTDKSGKYYYSRSADFKSFLHDLTTGDSQREFLVKLKQSEPLALHRKVILIYKENNNGLWAFACAPLRVGLVP